MDADARLAQFVGRHVVEVFTATLDTLLLLVVLAWVAFGLIQQRHRLVSLSMRRRLLATILLGLGVAAIAGVVFVESTEALDVRDTLGRFDVSLAQVLQQRPSSTASKFFSVTAHLGDVNTLTVLCVAVAGWLLWRGRQALAVAWILALAGGAIFNSLLKLWFERARPVHEQSLVVAEGFSFPSGHSSGAVVAYGMLAYITLRFVAEPWRLPILLSVAALAFTVGFSRLILQVHYASDVLAGFASGVLWLAVCIGCIEWLRLRREDPRRFTPSD